ncbi:response regulator [Eubacteriales bacterium OttesenSCG-928-N13]|nr:response regulator [Eubacteriales bacterium OttesenSCG-928-N13]
MNKLSMSMRTRLIIIFVVVKVIPIIILTIIAWNQIIMLGDTLREIAVTDSSAALNASAVENIERMTTDTAHEVAEFLYDRDDDIRYLASIEPTEDNYRHFAEAKIGRLVKKGTWELAEDGQSWVRTDEPAPITTGGESTNAENNDLDGYHYRYPEQFEYYETPLYDQISFIGLNGVEEVKYTSPNSGKINHPMNPEKLDVSIKANTYIKAETYYDKLKDLKPGDIYVSDVIGAYVGSNYIGMYVPDAVQKAANDRGYDIPYEPEKQSYAGQENPNGERFEGIVRWITPATDENGQITGYVSFALNHDHIMEFVDHNTPMNERYTEIPSAYEGNYSFIWDYNCRSICHPRHNSIVGYDPETGDPEIPWLETSIYEAWQESGVVKWMDFVADLPTFNEQSRTKKPAPILTQQGLVGLDGRYLDNAPQCTGWMDLSKEGGSGSFYILWSGLYKLTTTAAIPYYTGQYAPSEANDFSKRGFGVVTIGAGLDDFTRPAEETRLKLDGAVEENLSETFTKLIAITVLIVILLVLIAIWLASSITGNITNLIKGISRFRAGERQFRFNSTAKDEFGTLADSFDDMADSIVDSVKNPLSITDMNARIIYMNQQGLDFCGVNDLIDVVGHPYGEVSVYTTNSQYDPIVALHEGKEADIIFVEENQRYVKGVASYLQNKDGENIGYIIVSQDVTQMVLDQLVLERAVNDANNANQHKGEFLARMSHEIRTPMNAIIGLTNIVQRKLGCDTPGDTEVTEVREHVKQIESSSQHLLGLLNDILDLSKIEAGKIELTDEVMELSKLADTVNTIIRPRCHEKNIDFVTHIKPFSPSIFIGDALRLRQVLINLLGNAVKFTHELGKVEFSIRCLDRKEGKSLIEFSVRDNGIGISPEMQATIFQPFEQASGSITRQYGGTGLGLSISRHIVNLFGGDIMLNSTPGEGSEFLFAIWLTEYSDIVPKEASANDVTGMFKGKRALLVDDVDINRMIVKSMLEITDMDIDEANDGQVAVDMFKASAVGGYDIIFMDIQMPNVDGYQASDMIRALDRDDARTVPIIALTANAFKEDIDRAIEHGMNAHMTKPVDMDKLSEVLIKYIPSSSENS